jgi:Domain of unknown function (DUF1992)
MRYRPCSSQTGGMSGSRYSAEKKIREAQASGKFDNLPGAGKPLDLGNLHDPNWWVKGLIEREKIDPSELVHPTLALRREADSFPESLLGLRTEDQVRAVLQDFNERVRAEWRRPQVGRSFPVIARLVRVEETVARWRELREQAEAEARAAAETLLAVDQPLPRRRWWSRWRRPASSAPTDVRTRG